ncbi:MAG: hypothetical protein D9V44_04075 [Actinobacteria bacterium]|nr:MAG: hypothetical protein D9V44_04075 [Actinomycetota bacterium]
MILAPGFVARDTATVARELLGKVLISTAGDTVTGGRIVETGVHPGNGHTSQGRTGPRRRTPTGPDGKVKA